MTLIQDKGLIYRFLKQKELMSKKKDIPDLINFVCDTHQRMFNEKFLVKPFHEEICELLTRCALRTIEKNLLVINVPPRYGKTQLLSYYVMWCFLKNEMARFIYSTYSQKLTLKTSREIRKGLMQIHGRRSSFSKDSAELWETTAGGGFWATTMGGAVTGFGAGDLYGTPYGGDLHIDDPQKVSDAFYETKRNNLIENYTQTFWSRRNNLNKIPIVIWQQRVHTQDLSGWLMRDSGFPYERLVIKAMDDNGESTFPERVSKETLLELRNASEYTFAAQQQQEPQAFTGKFFSIDKTEIIDVKEFKKNEWLMKFFVRSWDFAGVKKEKKPSDKNDYTRGVLCCTDGEYVYIMDVKSHRGTVDLNDSLLVKTAHEDGYNVTITVPEDPGSAGQHYVDYLQNLPQLEGYTLNAIRPTHNKQLRAAPFAAFLNRGKVKIVSDDDDDEKWNATLLSELASFPFGEHDDIVDGLSDAFQIIHSVHKFIS